ncbi:MAG: L-lactate permease [Proteobacteria bacterium]|nr:L-lactate permease [Pseudomonadota bacterium]
MLTLLAWSPVLLLFFMAVFHRQSALTLAVWGISWTAGIAVLFFETPVRVVFLAALDGLLVTVPLLLVVYGGILLASVLIPSGSLARLAQWFTQGVRDEWGQLSLLTLGLGNTLEGAGIIAEPVAAPMLRASGLAPLPSAALSVIGYSGLMTLGLGGVIITVLAGVTGYPKDVLARDAAILSIPASVLMAWCIPFFAGRSGFRPGRLGYLFAMGLIAGLAALAGVGVIGYQVGELAGGAALVFFLVIPGIRRLRVTRTVLKDAAPLAALGAGIVLVNGLPLAREFAGSRFAFDLSIIPGRAIPFRPLADAYLYLFIAFIAAHFLHDRGRGVCSSLLRGSRQGWRTILAMALFGGMGQILSFSGWDLVSGLPIDQARNIPRILSESLLKAGPVYVVLVPFLGWVGTFLTGYGVASIMLFATLQITIAGKLGLSPEWLVSGLAVGASLGGISSPFKIAFAASMCGAAGMEGKILRKTIPLGILACLLLGVVMVFR